MNCHVITYAANAQTLISVNSEVVVTSCHCVKWNYKKSYFTQAIIRKLGTLGIKEITIEFYNFISCLMNHINIYIINSKKILLHTCILMTLKDIKGSCAVNCENANIMIIATSCNQPTRIEVTWRYDAHTRYKIWVATHTVHFSKTPVKTKHMQ